MCYKMVLCLFTIKIVQHVEEAFSANCTAQTRPQPPRFIYCTTYRLSASLEQLDDDGDVPRLSECRPHATAPSS